MNVFAYLTNTFSAETPVARKEGLYCGDYTD